MKHKITNDLTFWDFKAKRAEYEKIAFKYFEIWKNRDITIDISKKKWLQVNLKSRTKSVFVRIYLLSTKNRVFLDNEFDKLQADEKLT